MKEKRTGRSSAKLSSDWNRVGSLNDREVRRAIQSDPDARPTDADFWKNARVVIPRPKQTVTIRLDADLLDWFRSQKGYQTRINAVLRSYMDVSLSSGKQLLGK
jgi:uncharacterized protein (DUF4415 family)